MKIKVRVKCDAYNCPICHPAPVVGPTKPAWEK